MSGERDLKNKKVIITGGNAGISKSIAENFLKSGISKLAIVDINAEVGNKVTNEFNKTYGPNKVYFFKCDVTNRAEVDEVFDNIVQQFKTVDVIVNGAGVVNEKDWELCIDINLTSLIYWTFKVWNLMRADRGGPGATILNIASIYGIRTDKFWPVYHGSKYGVIGFSQSLGGQYHYNKTKVRVLTLCPGFTDTALLTAKPGGLDSPELDQLYIEHITKKVILQPAEHVGVNVLDIFKNGDSGTHWVVEEKLKAYKVQ